MIRGGCIVLERSWRRKLRLHLIFSLLLYNSGERDREQDAGTHHGSSSSAQGNLWRGRSSLFKFSLFLGHLFFLIFLFSYFLGCPYKRHARERSNPPLSPFLMKMFSFFFFFFQDKKKRREKEKGDQSTLFHRSRRSCYFFFLQIYCLSLSLNEFDTTTWDYIVQLFEIHFKLCQHFKNFERFF